MKIPAFKLKKKTNSYKPLIFQNNRLPQPKIPLRLFTKVNKPNLYEPQKFTIFVEEP